jgi:hypothetical protein
MAPPYTARTRFFLISGDLPCRTRTWPRRLALTAALASIAVTAGAAGTRGGSHGDQAFRLPDHYEFDATIAAAFRADDRDARDPTGLRYPAGSDRTIATWQVDVLDQRGVAVQRFLGEAPLHGGRGLARLAFDGRHASGPGAGARLLFAAPARGPGRAHGRRCRQALAERAAQSFALAREEMIDQRVDIIVGNVAKPRMPASRRCRTARRRAAPRSRPARCPTRSTTATCTRRPNHSDGGTPVGSCAGSEVPQGGTMGPAEAYAMMQTQAGGDFLLTSEHNHMYDGSTSTNTSANPPPANNMFNSGLSAAASYRSAHPDFLALYGNEWGVISNGGHLNILNPDGLASWEYNAATS